VHWLDEKIFQSIEGLGWPTYALVRVLLAATCGGLIGLERELRGRQAGLRTNLLVCLGASVVMIVSTRFAGMKWNHEPGVNVTVDPARLAYGVMAGIGLLCAGAILKHGGNIRGLTTAAGLWCVTALGLAAGLGLYTFVVFTTFLMLLVLWGLEHVERHLPRYYYRVVTLRRPWSDDCVSRTVLTVRERGFRVADWTFERGPDGTSVDLHLNVAFTTRHQFDELEGRLLKPGDPFDLIAVREE